MIRVSISFSFSLFQTIIYLSFTKFYPQITITQNPVTISIALIYIFTIPMNLILFTNIFFSLMAKMVSQQKLYHYIDNVEETERNWDEPKAEEGWPKKGKIECFNTNIRYRKDLPLVLNNQSFTIEPKQNCAIVGRTGCGKSTLISAILRILEQGEESKGYFMIDGKRTDELGIHEIRKKIKLIPQDPVIIEGTLKQNFDPIGECKDKLIIDALTEVGMYANISNYILRENPSIKKQ